MLLSPRRECLTPAPFGRAGLGKKLVVRCGWVTATAALNDLFCHDGLASPLALRQRAASACVHPLGHSTLVLSERISGPLPDDRMSKTSRYPGGAGGTYFFGAGCFLGIPTQRAKCDSGSILFTAAHRAQFSI